MPLNESDTRAKLIDQRLYLRGWTEDLIRREESAGAVEIIGGKPQRRTGRVDYTLRLKVNPTAQPVAVALIEAKSEAHAPEHGLEQAKGYAERSKRLNVPFVYSTNGHLFVEYDRTTGMTSPPRPMDEFPSPHELRQRWEAWKGFSLDDPVAKPLVTRYQGGEGTRRYYQDAAIRAVFEQIAQQEMAGGPRRALLALATGSGKTFIAVNLAKRIADAELGQRFKVLFVCDRDELKKQGLAAFQSMFGPNAQAVGKGFSQKNADILVATYQTLDVDTDDADANFLIANYPENFFSHIIIDECHRSAWGKWRRVLDMNPMAVHIGLTATPRQLAEVRKSKDTEDDLKIMADNYAYFGEPVYEYSIAQGIEDGYLAACEIVRSDVIIDSRDEDPNGLTREQLADRQITDAHTGSALSAEELDELYAASKLDKEIVMPERIAAMCRDLFSHLLATGGPEQKTIIFCTRDSHADRVAIEMNNLYNTWARDNGQAAVQNYAFKCTAQAETRHLDDLKGMQRNYFVATTVDLLSTGVDIPSVRNIVFFRYVTSPILFYQMVGRGTRLDPTTNKLMFRVYDYTNATQRFGEAFVTRLSQRSVGTHELDEEARAAAAEAPPDAVIQVEGFEIHTNDAGRFILSTREGRAMPVAVEEYEAELAKRLVAEAPTVDDLRQRWVNPDSRKQLVGQLTDAGYSPSVLRVVRGLADCDLYDVLADLGYGLAPFKRSERAYAFNYKNRDWLDAMPQGAADTIRALTQIFANQGIEELENKRIFSTPAVQRAGGVPALKLAGDPAVLLLTTKERIFAA